MIKFLLYVKDLERINIFNGDLKLDNLVIDGTNTLQAVDFDCSIYLDPLLDSFLIKGYTPGNSLETHIESFKSG